ncbi:MAG: glycerophosphodiester phosphodiesterase [Gammaproteobacteria bacterium]
MKQLICMTLLFLHCLNAYSFDLYGHRGARGLAPENTLPGYQKALALGVDYIDMDVMMTKDNIIVVQHDLTLNPNLTRDAKGQWIPNNKIVVKDLTLKQLQSYDVGRIKSKTQYAQFFPEQQSIDGTRIPTLKEVIDYAKAIKGDHIGFQIEIKNDPNLPNATHTPEELARAIVKLLVAEKIVDRTQVQAYDWRCLLAIQKLNPHIATAYLTDQDQEKLMHDKDPQKAGLWTAGRLLKDYHDSIPQMIKAMGGKFWDPQDTTITPERIREAHQLGLKVVAWSWTEKAGKDVDVSLVKKLIAMGVDGIITDRPDVVGGLRKDQVKRHHLLASRRGR